MTEIHTLFDPSRGIHRSIEKVISYQASQAERLKAEITEYIVTDSIEDQLERLLENIQAAMESGGGHEVGVWVSGFYGSGKSSFTKYLGLAFDQTVQVDGQPFLRHLQDRLHRAQTKALLSTVAARFPAAVVMLDLASEQIAGATLAEVSTVLYYKVLQYAGYSRNLKVAAFERRLKKDGRFPEFEAMFRQETGEPWADYQNDELVVDSLLPRLAHRLYPALFRSDQAFTTETSESIYLMDDRVQEMIELARERSGKEHVVFVIDEIGQYVGSNQNKILDLQGLAENLKNIGQGKVWIIGTAQQTLTEDDPRSAINSPELFKLKDRFPITVELESSDIREICYRRLLAKSSAGEATLGHLFDRHGQALRHNTKLADAKFYDSGLDRKIFIDLYPFLPAHFDILLHLLGALAKSTGGIGLRSAIKVVQDILIEEMAGQPPVANAEVGWLATTVTLYDALEKDIRRAFPSVHKAVETVGIGFTGDRFTQDVGKTIAVLQILGNMPVTAHNVASLMHPAVDGISLADAVKQAVDAMLKHARVPLGEKGDDLRFFSEKLNDVEQERAQLALRSPDLRRIVNDALREVFDPLPNARLNGSLTVTSGIRHLQGGQATPLAGERETVQTMIVFAEPSEYEAERARLLDESRHRSSENLIYMLGRAAQGAQDLAAEIFRCHRIAELHRHDPDQEVKEYCASQIERAGRLSGDLARLLSRGLVQGSFIFRGRSTAVDSLDSILAAAARKHLADAAAQIFDRYQEAPERAATDIAEKFLRAAGASLRGVAGPIDPLGLVRITGGAASIDTDHKALVSIKDHVERAGTVEGKRLLDFFSGPPFGWSQDTTRYLLAALLVAGEIKLKVSGREVTANGQQAIDALKNNNSFKPVGIALRHDKPSMGVLLKASERLTELSGDQVLPLENDISKAAQKVLPNLARDLGPLAERLTALGLPGGEMLESAGRQMADMMLADASDAPQRFGAEDSPLYDALKWGQAARLAFDQGVGDTIRDLRALARAVEDLPTTGVPGELREAVRDDQDAVTERLAQEDFYRHRADLGSRLTALQARVAEAVGKMAAAQAQRLRDAEQELELLQDWAAFTPEERASTLAGLQGLAIPVADDIGGLRKLIARQYDIDQTIADLKIRIKQEAQERRQRDRPVGGGAAEERARDRRSLSLPPHIATAAELDALIGRLQALRAEMPYAEFDIVIGEG